MSIISGFIPGNGVAGLHEVQNDGLRNSRQELPVSVSILLSVAFPARSYSRVVLYGTVTVAPVKEYVYFSSIIWPRPSYLNVAQLYHPPLVDFSLTTRSIIRVLAS